MGASVTATRAALELIEGLTARYGPLAFHQSGRCCDGSAPMCLRRGELPPGRYDIQLGELAGAPFYVDFDLYRRWGSPQLVIDVSASTASGMSQLTWATGAETVCTIGGSYAQGSIDGTLGCGVLGHALSNGTTAEVAEITPGPHGFAARVRFQRAACTYAGHIGGVRLP